MLISNLIFVLKSHCRKFKITNRLINKSPFSPFKIDMSQQDNDFEDPKFTLKILKYVTTEKMALLVTCYIHPTWYVLPSLGSSTEELNNNKNKWWKGKGDCGSSGGGGREGGLWWE